MPWRKRAELGEELVKRRRRRGRREREEAWGAEKWDGVTKR